MQALPAHPSSHWLSKVTEVSLSFWILKVMSTTVGETGADFLSVDAGWGQGMIHALRRKLGSETIKNVRGVGWMVSKSV